ncbi:MAG TPA: VOC family protein [Mucilaginibacter sp.]|jgi:catechol-2,3-dioxygenase
MGIKFIDHIVIIVKNIPETKKFYNSFLGQPEHETDENLVYKVGDTRVFFVLPKGVYEKTDKDKSGLNHVAFGVRSLEELKSNEEMLNKAFIHHSGIRTDKHGNKDYIWLDDPSDIRVEIYSRPLE